MIILYIALGCLVGWWALWVMFLAVMHLKHINDDVPLNKSAYGLAMSVLAVGYLVDFLINMTAATCLAPCKRAGTANHKMILLARDIQK